MTNDEIMNRFGFRICATCNADMPGKGFVDGDCRGCAEIKQEGEQHPAHDLT